MRGCCGGSFEVCARKRRGSVGSEKIIRGKREDDGDILRAAGAELRGLKVTNQSVKPTNDGGLSPSEYTDRNLKNENDVEDT